MLKVKTGILAGLVGLLMAGTPAFAGPDTVAGPGENPTCFKPWDAKTKHFKWAAKKGPYRIAIANGFGTVLLDHA